MRVEGGREGGWGREREREREGERKKEAGERGGDSEWEQEMALRLQHGTVTERE